MDITIDNSDNLYCSGNISANSITGLTNVLEFFDNLIGTTKTIASGDTALNEDTLVFKLSNDGAVVFREIIDASNGEEACHSIHYNNNIILCGGFKSYKVDGDLINKDISVLGFGAFEEDPTYFTADDVKIDSNHNYYFSKFGRVRKFNACGVLQSNVEQYCETFDLDYNNNQYCITSNRIIKKNANNQVLFDGFSDLPTTLQINDLNTYQRLIDVTSTHSLPEIDINFRVTLDTTALVSAGKMRSDCRDARFFDQAGNFIKSWVADNSCNTTTTDFWIRLPILLPGVNQIKMTYGATSFPKAICAEVFPTYFEDFISVTIDQWMNSGLVTQFRTLGQILMKCSNRRL